MDDFFFVGRVEKESEMLVPVDIAGANFLVRWWWEPGRGVTLGGEATAVGWTFRPLNRFLDWEMTEKEPLA